MAARPYSRVVKTRHGRYDVATIPLPACPIPGFRASLIQAVDAGRPRRRAIRLTLYEREHPGGGEPRAA